MAQNKAYLFDPAGWLLLAFLGQEQNQTRVPQFPGGRSVQRGAMPDRVQPHPTAPQVSAALACHGASDPAAEEPAHPFSLS